MLGIVFIRQLDSCVFWGQMVQQRPEMGQQPRQSPGMGLRAIALRVAACYVACPCPAWVAWLPKQPMQVQHRPSA